VEHVASIFRKAFYLLDARFSLGLFLDLEELGEMFLETSDYTALYLAEHISLHNHLFENLISSIVLQMLV
jgi:hypothetical protein